MTIGDYYGLYHENTSRGRVKKQPCIHGRKSCKNKSIIFFKGYQNKQQRIFLHKYRARIMISIEDYSFGRMQINGKVYTRDLKIIGSKVIPDWWRRSGHLVTIEDITDLIDSGPGIIILGAGDPGRMIPADDLKGHLEKKGIRLIACPTQKAAFEFNFLTAKGEKIAAGFHLTC